LQQATENYINAPNATAITKYDFAAKKLREAINATLRKSQGGALLFDMSALESNIEGLERTIFRFVEQGDGEKARALLANVEYEVLRNNFDAFILQITYRNKDVAQDRFSKMVLLSSLIETSKQQLGNVIFIIILSFIVVFSFGLVAIFVVSRSILIPLNRLIKGAEIIGRGNLGHKIDIESKDELGELTDSFNKMAEDLAGSMDKEKKLVAARATAEVERKRAAEIKEAYEEIQQKSEELRQVAASDRKKSEELTKKTAELEKFHKATMGRETRVIELKKEIDSILEQFGQPKRYKVV